MLPKSLQNLLERLPRNAEAPKAREAFRQVALEVLADQSVATELARYLGQCEEHDDQADRLMQILISVLDEARMAKENGKAVGAQFIGFLEEELGRFKLKGVMTSAGRLFLASCWGRAGLDAPEAVAADFSMFDDAEGAFEDLDPAEMGPLIDILLKEASGGDDGDLSALHAGFSEIIATLPAEVRSPMVQQVVARPKTVMGELGCALLFDRREEIRHGAIQGLMDRSTDGHLSPDLVGRLTILRSWVSDPKTITGIDAIVRHAIRNGNVSPQTMGSPKVHRALTSLIDGTGAQSMTVVLQSGGARKVAVILIKQGFGVKDAYLIPCSSASEQKRLVEMIASEVETRDVSLEYIATAIAWGLSDGLENNHPPAPGLVDVVQSLGLHDMRPSPASIADVVARADPEGKLDSMSVQAKGRLITASADWDMMSPMISESWYEDSDSFTDAIEGSKTPAAMKRALWQALEDRRDHWAKVIARMGHLFQAAAEPEASQFLAVAQALTNGRALKKTPIMELIFEQSFEVWLDRNVLGHDPSSPDASFEVTSGPVPAGMQMPKISPEKPGELEKLLKPAGLTEWWVDGYMMGVCTAPEFVAPGSWAEVLLNVIGPEIQSDKTLQRILDLLMLRYNGTLTKLRTPIGASLIPDAAPLISIWADGYLTAWEGNKPYWPKAKLGKDDKAARKLLEDAASWKFDADRFRKDIPNWLRHRFANQEGMHLT